MKLRSIKLTAITAAFFLALSPTSVSAEAPFSQEWMPQSWMSKASTSTPDTRNNLDYGRPGGQQPATPNDFKKTAPPGTCRLVVWDVGWDQGSNWLGVQGGRENCSNSASFTVEIRKDLRLRPDRVIGSTTGNNNQIVRAFGACTGPAQYYGQVRSSTGSELRGDNSGACR